MTDQRDKFKQELVQADSDIDRVDETRDQLENVSRCSIVLYASSANHA
jgi:hypothetical protein